MEIRKVAANIKVVAARGKVALERGPHVYCAEEADNPPGVLSLEIPENANLTYTFDKGPNYCLLQRWKGMDL